MLFASGDSPDHQDFSKIVENDLIIISDSSSLSTRGSIPPAPIDLDMPFVQMFPDLILLHQMALFFVPDFAQVTGAWDS